MKLVCSFGFYCIVFACFVMVRGQELQPGPLIPLGLLNKKAVRLYFPMPADTRVRPAGDVRVDVRIDLATSKVVSAKAVSGNASLRANADKAAMRSKFPALLKDFNSVIGRGILVYRRRDFSRRPRRTANPVAIIPLVNMRDAIVNGRALRLEKPDYPETARKACAGGKVEVLVLFHANRGEAIAAKAQSGNGLLFRESEMAVIRSKFGPGLISADVFMTGRVVYNFDSMVDPQCHQRRPTSFRRL